MTTLFLIIFSTVLVSLISFIGVFALALKDKILEKILSYLVALSVGAMMGSAFLDLIPEAIEKHRESGAVFLYILVGFMLFFIVEKILHWRHCHQGHCDIHSIAQINLFGDALHNFIDGLIIAASFMAGNNIGWAVTLAIIIHEIPQEISDFGVLVYAGFKKSKAIFYNFLSAVLAIGGGIFGYYLLSVTDILIVFLLPAAAGGFIYIAAADLTPEVKKEVDTRKSFWSLIIILAGILIMYGIKLLGLE